MGLISLKKEHTARTEETLSGQWVYCMKKNKVLKTVLSVLAAIIILLLVAVLCVFLYLRHLASSLPDTLPDDPSASVVQPVLTDDDLDKLLSGEITLDDLTSELPSSSAAEEDASASIPAGESAASSTASSAASSASSGTDSSGSTAASSSSTGASSAVSSSGSISSSSSSTSTKTEAAYETEVKALLQQLYATKARAEAELNACVAGAKAEYKALPESQQTQARKVSIVLARSGKLYAMQAAYDKEVEGIVSQMRAVLTANGQSTALADQAMASYKAQKSATYSQLMAKLYS